LDSQPDKRPLRILIVRVGAMGDVLHGLPAVAALRAAMPDSFIGWAVEPRWRTLLGAPVVDRIHDVPTREWKAKPFSVATLRQIARLRREMQKENYDVCIDLQGSIRSAVIGRMSAATRFVGPRKPRERQARAFYGERVDVRAKHVIEQACELVGAGVGLQLAPARLTLPHDPAAEAWCDHLEIDRRFVLLAPTAGWGAKQWGAERYRDLALQLEAKGLQVLINGGSGTDSTIINVAQATQSTVISCTLPELVALTRRAGLVIGGDTGPIHLAAALARPVVALFGPTDPDRNGPDFVGATSRVIRHPASVLDHRRHEETEAGLAQVSVDEVFAAAMTLLDKEI
jgi:heptosyltransferase-1